MLLFISFEDVKKKEVDVRAVLAMLICTIGISLLQNDFRVGVSARGLLTGFFVYLLGFISNEKIGTGDGLVLMVTGIVVGAEVNLMILIRAILFAVIWVFIKGKKYGEIPFVPCILLATLSVVLQGVAS